MRGPNVKGTWKKPYTFIPWILSLPYSYLMLKVPSSSFSHSLLRVRERCKMKMFVFKTSDGWFSSVRLMLSHCTWSLHFWFSVIPVVPQCFWSDLHSCDGIPKLFKGSLFSLLSSPKNCGLICTHLTLFYSSSSLFPVSWELAKSPFFWKEKALGMCWKVVTLWISPC